MGHLQDGMEGYSGLAGSRYCGLGERGIKCKGQEW